MFTALLSFLGGSVFRLIFGELMNFANKKQDHGYEMDRMKFQAEVDAAQHARNLEAITVQANLGVKTIQVQAEAAVGELEAQGWLEAVKGTTKTVGIAWVDAWNAVIRPGVATWAIVMMTGEAFTWWTLSETTLAICGAALGIYLASRDLFKQGK